VPDLNKAVGGFPKKDQIVKSQRTEGGLSFELFNISMGFSYVQPLQ
jgi:hypothetical protein